MNDDNKLEIESIFDLAIKNHLENKIDIAQSLYERVLKINPNHSRALNNLGILSYNLNKNDKAIECFQKAIKINPLEADAHNNDLCERDRLPAWASRRTIRSPNC